jgi:hypothetical protein
MANYTYADARGTEQLTAAGLKKVLGWIGRPWGTPSGSAGIGLCG